MTFSRNPRRVVQAYRRLDDEMDEGNPYPDISAGSQAILATRSGQDGVAGWANIEPPHHLETPSGLRPVRGLNPYILLDSTVLGHAFSVPEKFPETRFRLNDDDRFEPVRGRDREIPDGDRIIVETRFKPGAFSGAKAAVHTHPRTGDPWPGPGDGDLPRSYGIPLYGVTKDGVWRVNPPDDSGQMTVDLIRGDWGARQEDVDRAIKRLNEDDRAKRR